MSAESMSTADGKAGLAHDHQQTWGFSDFVAANEQGLRQSLTAALGPDVGRDAAAEALVYGWENWERVSDMENPSGYLYRVGLNWGKDRLGRRSVRFLESVSEPDPWFEPGLPDALAGLSEKQRVVVYLVHGHDWTLSEVAGFLEISKGSVQTHMERGMAKLRRQLKVKT